MTGTDAAGTLRPFFLDGRAGRLFALFIPASSDRQRGEAVLMCPPFAEEMNKSRRQVMLQAQAFAASGRDVLLLDLYGTGDSAGDFADGDWSLWLDDLERAANWLIASGASSIVLWGIRLGSLLAIAMARHGRLPVGRLLLWQPVTIGKIYMTQFLRLRLAAGMVRGAGGETTAGLRETLKAGESLEIAGYRLSPTAFAAIEALDLKRDAAPALPKTDWIEIVASEERGMTPAARSVVAALRDGGSEVESHTVVGEAFWNAPEITLVPELVTTSMAVFA